MKDMYRKDIIFTKEEMDDIFLILEYSAISLLDIRHHLISPEEALKDCILPSSAFLFTYPGKAEVLLGDKSYQINHFSLFHGGKGTSLSIIPHGEWLEYYMIFYKTGETQFHKEKLKKLLKQINPFQQQYGFTPQNPVFFTELLRSIYEHWNEPAPMKKFYEKSLFYQFTYELYKELAEASVLTFDPNIVKMTIRYIEKNYATSIAVQDLCQRFGISYSHFYRLFKKETGSTFQGYLLKIRLEKARQYMIESSYSLSEIAKFTGFYDEFHLSSSFKKLTGMSPATLRKNLTWDKKYPYMENPEFSHYNEAYQVSQDKLNTQGDIMLKHLKNKTAVMAAALSFMTLLSGCSTALSVSDNTTLTASQAADNQNSQKDDDSQKSETKILQTVKGDVEIPVTPKRVVTDSGLLGDILALGVTPIAIENYGAEDVSYKDLIKDITVLEKWEPEYIMAEQPDLIITQYEENYEQLSKIAPTVYVPSDQMTVDEELSFLAGSLGKDPEEGKKILDAYFEKVAEYKAKLEEAGLYNKTFSVIRVQGENQIGVRWSNNLGGQILFGALELPKTEGAQEEIDAGHDWGATLSFEALPKYMGDYILVTEYGNYDLIKDNPIWKSLPAVEAGNIIILSEPFMYLNDIYSWSAQLDLVGDALLELAKKEK